MVLLGLLEAFGIGAHTGLKLPLRGFDRGRGGRPTFGGITFMLDQLARFDLMISPLLAERGQRLLRQLRRRKTLGLQVEQLLGDGLMFSLLGVVECSLGPPGSGLGLDHQPALRHAKMA